MRRENKTRHVIIKEGTPEEMNKEINEIFETPNTVFYEELVKGELEVVKR